jgi:hypothetical protein
MRNRFVLIALFAAMAQVLAPGAARAQSQSNPPPASRDGSHDMDFNLGTWHTEITRHPDPLGEAAQTVHLAGTVTVRPVWNGKAQFEEIEAEGPNGHWEGGTLFLYDPAAHQWSQNFVAASAGRIDAPTIGEFRNGNIEYYAQEESGGRAVLLRGIWSDIEPNSHSYEEDLSNDGGRTWHAAFVAHLTRIGR